MKVTRSRRYKKGTGNTKPCDHCGQPSVGRIDYAVSWLRGDDEVYFLCREAFDMIKCGRADDLEMAIQARQGSEKP